MVETFTRSDVFRFLVDGDFLFFDGGGGEAGIFPEA